MGKDYSEKLQWEFTIKPHCTDEDRRKVRSLSEDFGLAQNDSWEYELDLQSPDAEAVLERIRMFCSQKGWSAIATYVRQYRAADSGWYEIAAEEFEGTEGVDFAEWVSNGRKKRLFPEVHAYRLTDGKPRTTINLMMCVPDRWRQFCLDNGYDDVRFCWLKDSGDYAGEQYFAMLPEAWVSERLEAQHYWQKGDLFSLSRRRRDELGGSLPRLCEVFPSFSIVIQPCYLKKDMPDSPFAYVKSRTRHLSTLIRKDAAEKMLKEGLISESSLIPVAVLDEPLPGYRLRKCTEEFFPDEETCRQRLQQYADLIAADRPRLTINDQTAVELLKKRKAEWPKDFAEGLPEEQLKQLRESPWVPLAEYYEFSDGFLINEDWQYRMLSFAQAREMNEEWRKKCTEETCLYRLRGVIFGTVRDIGYLLLNEEGRVVEIDNEDFLTECSWRSMAQFIFDNDPQETF